MNQYNPYQSPAMPAQALVNERAQFIVRTYGHLFGAILAFTGFEVLLFKTGLALPIARAALAGNWLLVLGAFMVVSWIATHAAGTASSKLGQYAGLGLYVVAQGLIFVPLLYIAEMKAEGIIASAAGVTLLGFAGLTAVAFVTRKDFSFLRGFIMWGGIVALLAIVGSVIFGLSLGTFFSVAMVGLAGAAILYDTSNILHHYPADRYVGASLHLFASVAMMFWYVLRIFSSRN